LLTNFRYVIGFGGEAMKKIIPVVLIAASVAACVTPDASLIGPYPKNYKATVKAYIETAFVDPYSLRSVSISEPSSGHIMMQQGWVVCLLANSRNRMGGYTGLRMTALLINNDAVVYASQDFPQCYNASLAPWKEVEAK
jgi:hypothetical protein